MRSVKYFLLAALVMSITSLGVFRAADKDAPKYTIKEVMKIAHKDGLAKKAIEGKASADEKKKLVELYTALAADKPPVGGEESWKEKTTVIVAASKDLAAGKEGADKALMKATNCKACHEVHKGK